MDDKVIIERVTEIMGVITEFGRMRYRAGSSEDSALHEKYCDESQKHFSKLVNLIYDFAYDKERRGDDE